MVWPGGHGGVPRRLRRHLGAAALTELMARGVCQRFAFDTYEREIERFGGPAGTAAAETMFAADSAAVVDSSPPGCHATSPSNHSPGTQLSATLDDLHAGGDLTCTPTDLHGSVVHLHLNRSLAADHPTERCVFGLLSRLRAGLAASARVRHPG